MRKSRFTETQIIGMINRLLKKCFQHVSTVYMLRFKGRLHWISCIIRGQSGHSGLFQQPVKEREAGLTVAEVCRKHGISPASYYKLKAKYGGMDVSDARRLKQLEEERAIEAPLVRAQWRGRSSSGWWRTRCWTLWC